MRSFEAFLKKLPFQGTGEDVDHLLTIWKILGLPNTKLYPEVADLEWYWLFNTRVKPKKSIFSKLYKHKVTPQLFHLLRCIFQHDPKKRPTAAEVLAHPFFTSESPLPQSAGDVLETVEGDWHELEYKMIRDKEKAEVRRKQEDNVILGYLKHKQEEHERKLQEAILDSEVESETRRIKFYKAEYNQFESRLLARPKENESNADHAQQVAEMKKTHGDMYMDHTRRGRYRGPEREKVDEKLLGEAWKWWEEEKKKGATLASILPSIPKPEKEAAVAQPKLTVKSKPKPKPSPLADGQPQSKRQKRSEKKQLYAQRRVVYDQLRNDYDHRKEERMRTYDNMNRNGEKRLAQSPLVGERDTKKPRDVV